MRWLNLEVSTIRSEEYVGSEPVERATWLNVLAYSCELENGGRIVGAATWKDRQWQQTCGVTLKEVRNAPRLLRWEGDDLIVMFYPMAKQREVQDKRAAGRIGGSARTEAKAQAVRDNGALGGRPETKAHPQAQGEAEPKQNLSTAPEDNLSENLTERKGREGKGKEGKENSAADATPGQPLVLESSAHPPSHPPAHPPTQPVADPLPAVLDTPDFKAAWADWLAYRRERKLTAYKPRPLAAQIAQLAEWGHDGAIASIRESIRQQWQGLFAPKFSPMNRSTGGHPFQMPATQHEKGF